MSKLEVFMFIILVLSSLLICEDKIPRPEPLKVLKTIEELHLDDEQLEKIKKELEKNLKRFDEINKKYQKKLLQKEEIEREIWELKNKLFEYNKNVTFIIKSYLNEEQMKKLNEIIKKQREKDLKEKSDKTSEETDKEAKDIDKIKDKSKEEKLSPFSIYFP